ncbi:MAG: EF-hand domain-containing protein [Reichenbachiella sp.]
MEDTYRKNKFSHLFNILDFDHDGLLQASDFKNLGDNIATFRCLEYPSEIEGLILTRGEQFWQRIQEYLSNQPIKRCNLNNWLGFLNDLTDPNKPERFHSLVKKSVDDIFLIYDVNKDNFISKHDFLCLFVSLRVEIKQADECFRQLDLNGDQLISREEMILAIMQFFVSEDKEKTGNLIFGNPDDYRFTSKKTYLRSRF